MSPSHDDAPTAPAAAGQKRARVEQACDRCRRMKLKCDGKTPICHRCNKYSKVCTYTHVSKAQSSREQELYVQALETRVHRMESLLKELGLIPQDGSIEDVDVDDESLTNLVGDSPNELGFEFDFDPEDLALSEASPPDCWDAPMPSNSLGDFDHVTSDLLYQVFQISPMDDVKDLFPRRIFFPLPPRTEVYTLVAEYFSDINALVPLYSQRTFMTHLNDYYSSEAECGPAWWASINVVLALAYITRARNSTNDLSPQALGQKAWNHVKNALAVYSELSVVNTDLLSAQALIGMTMFFEVRSNPRPSAVCAAAALRILHTIGLHKGSSGAGMDREELEQRKRVFWTAYIYDKEHSLRSGRPPLANDDDFDLDLPADSPEDDSWCMTTRGLAFIGGSTVFRHKCAMARIKSKIYRQLYSTKSLDKPERDVINSIIEVDKELEAWKDQLPDDLKPDASTTDVPDPVKIHILLLRFDYYHCVSLIHRRPWMVDPSQNGRSISPTLDQRSLFQKARSSRLCVQAARKSIQTLQFIPDCFPQLHCFILYFAASAHMVLFGNIVQNPRDPAARGDIERLRAVHHFTSTIPSPSTDISQMIALMKGCEQIAVQTLDAAANKGSSTDAPTLETNQIPQAAKFTCSSLIMSLSKLTSASTLLSPGDSSGTAKFNSLPMAFGLERHDSSTTV